MRIGPPACRIAVLDLPAMPVWGLLAAALGGIWLVIWRTSWRYWGLAPLLLAAASPFPAVRPTSSPPKTASWSRSAQRMVAICCRPRNPTSCGRSVVARRRRGAGSPVAAARRIGGGGRFAL
ncbi:MAG: hypothetical protein WDN69_33250 [Aliidongia sp.]